MMLYRPLTIDLFIRYSWCIQITLNTTGQEIVVLTICSIKLCGVW